jgi:hypothetical protein
LASIAWETTLGVVSVKPQEAEPSTTSMQTTIAAPAAQYRANMKKGPAARRPPGWMTCLRLAEAPKISGLPFQI